MTSIELEAQKASLAREILNTDNIELLNELEKTFQKLKKKMHVAEKEEETISKEEVLDGIDRGLKEVKLSKERKLKPKSAREFLNEL